MTKQPHLFIFGPGYTAREIAKKALSHGWRVSGTFREPDKESELRALGIAPVPFAIASVAKASCEANYWLVSTAPGPDGDPTLRLLQEGEDLSKAPKWIGYLSSTNVYGNHDGAWVDEATAPTPGLARGIRRMEAETQWEEKAQELGARSHIFRLAGIYGPGRNAVRSLIDGKARRIIKPGQLFSRIHVTDIAQAVWLSMNSDLASDIFNLADDEPCPPQDVITAAALAMGITPPPEIPFEEAELSPMARSFYEESKRVRNDHAKKVLGLKLQYPNFQAALSDLVENEK